MVTLIERLSAEAPADRLRALQEAAALDADGVAAEARLVREIVARLEDQEAPIRRAALEAIALLENRGAHRFDRATLRRAHDLAADPAPEVRAEAAVVLAFAPRDDLQASLQTLQRLLEDAAAPVRREAAAALGDLGEREAISRLAEHLDDEDRDTAFEASFALASLGDERGLPLLVAALGDPRRRFDACEGLRRLKSRAAVPELRRISKKLLLSWPERLTVHATLYTLGERDAAEFLIGRTRAWSREERGLALALIGSHGVAEGREVLERIAADVRDPLQETAAHALNELTASR